MTRPGIALLALGVLVAAGYLAWVGAFSGRTLGDIPLRVAGTSASGRLAAVHITPEMNPLRVRVRVRYRLARSRRIGRGVPTLRYDVTVSDSDRRVDFSARGETGELGDSDLAQLVRAPLERDVTFSSDPFVLDGTDDYRVDARATLQAPGIIEAASVEVRRDVHPGWPYAPAIAAAFAAAGIALVVLGRRR